MSKAQKDIGSAHKQLERLPLAIHGHKMGNSLGNPIMWQRNFLPAKGWFENFFLLLKLTCPKHRKILELPTSNLKDLLKSFKGIKWAKQPRKPNHEAENFFACQGLVGELFSVAQFYMSKAQRDIGNTQKQLEKPPEILHGNKMSETD